MLTGGRTRPRGFCGCCPIAINHGKPVVPSSQRRGGRDLKQISPKASMLGAAGVVSPFLTTPSALSKEACAYLFDAQPPLLYEEGTICSEIDFVNVVGQQRL